MDLMFFWNLVEDEYLKIFLFLLKAFEENILILFLLNLYLLYLAFDIKIAFEMMVMYILLFESKYLLYYYCFYFELKFGFIFFCFLIKLNCFMFINSIYYCEFIIKILIKV